MKVKEFLIEENPAIEGKYILVAIVHGGDKYVVIYDCIKYDKLEEQ